MVNQELIYTEKLPGGSKMTPTTKIILYVEKELIINERPLGITESFDCDRVEVYSGEVAGKKTYSLVFIEV